MSRVRYIYVMLIAGICLMTGVSLQAVRPTFVAPYYFGPNAFPIPEIVDITSSTLNIEASGNYFNGRRGDHTYDFTLKTVIPLWSSRVNLSVWLPVMEWYSHSDLYLQSCGINPPYTDSMKKGSLTGDVYVTTDIHVLTERKIRPDIVVRAGIKTASGGGSEIARYYDCPGYFFDAAFSKSFVISSAHSLSLRASLAAGFLCWQTDKDRQNDAIMFGAKVRIDWKKLSIAETFSGYSGWEHMAAEDPHLAHDFPMSFKTRLSYSINDRWTLFGLYEHGLDDYPYRHFGLGVSYRIDILKSSKK